jgi:glucokinase
MNSDALALAVDIGGTQIKAGVMRANGEIAVLRRAETPAMAGPEAVVRLLLGMLHQLCADAGIRADQLLGVGISLAAFVTADGEITATAHLSREWIGFDLKSRLEQDLRTSYYFALDTPAPTLGEAYYGAGRDVDDFVFITISTGIGAGIMANRQYVTGGLGWAGGVGHTIIDEKSDRVCLGCGNHGCLETFAAKQGIVATACEMIRRCPSSLLAQLASQTPEGLSPHLVYDAARQGDEAAIEVFRLAGHHLGIGLTNLVDIVSPTRVVVGGGIALAGDLLLEPARAVVKQRAFPPRNRDVQIVPAALGDLSGMYGAAAMVFHNIRVNV